jgi:lipoprotein-releasing system ATP-binding protein
VDKGVRSPILELQNLQLAYRQGSREIKVLNGASGEVFPGEAVGLLGPSGSGKSSLLHIVGLLDHANAGAVLFDGQNCSELGDNERTGLRRAKLGFVYQFHHLLPEFSALENVMLPQMILGKTREQAEQRAEELLDALGLADRLEHRPAQLSGGEQQRVAIARAVANGPRLLLADEPTGNLDPHTAENVFQQLMALVRDTGLATIVATHNLDVARRMDRIWRLEDGHLVEAVPADI